MVGPGTSSGSHYGGGFNFSISLGIAQSIIKKFGTVCTLRREVTLGSGVWIDRNCYAAFPDWTPLERMGQIIDPLDRCALVSTEGLVTPPNQHLDLLVIWDWSDVVNPSIVEQLKISRPPGRLAPAPGRGNNGIIYWELYLRGMRGEGPTS